jgi:hypothetical protein
MITFIEKTLKRLGIISPIEKDDIINAQIENSTRDYDRTLTKLHAALEKRNTSMQHLRESLRMASTRTNSFADFERLTETLGRRTEEKH